MTKIIILVCTMAAFFTSACSPKHENNQDLQEDIKDKVSTETPITFNDDIFPLFANKCAICHLGGGLFDTQDYQTVLTQLNAIESRAIIQQTMPPNGPLSEAERSLIALWIEDGAQEALLENQF